MSLFHERERRAAKAYRCDECGVAIAVGERYCAWFQLVEGYAYSGHQCLACRVLWNEAWAAFRFCEDDAPQLGELRHTLREDYGIADPDAWAAEIVAVRVAAAERAAANQVAALEFQRGPA